jgi:hypothetical protein
MKTEGTRVPADLYLKASECVVLVLQDEPEVQHFTLAHGETAFLSPCTYWMQLCPYKNSFLYVFCV